MSGSTHYVNYYASYRMNPNNFEGSSKSFVEKHNANIPPSITGSNSNSNSNSYSNSNSGLYNIYVESGSPTNSATSSGVYITHSYFGNCGNVITTCVG